MKNDIFERVSCSKGNFQVQPAIPDAVQIARNTRRSAWQNVYFALAIKFIVMIIGLFGRANMWIAVSADTGVSMLCLLNSVRILCMK